VLLTISAQSATEHFLYSFERYSDGAFPVAGLKNVNGTLYGPTFVGGNEDCYSFIGYGCGSVFAFDPGTNQEIFAHRFTGGKDGAFPYTR
jgi:hypothetical protein